MTLTSAAKMMALITELYPVCRSITGNGVRETLRRMAQEVPLRIHEVPSGTKVFDWTVPDEWNIRSAFLEAPTGEKVVDFSDHSLHVVNYSVPVDRFLPLAELQQHLHSIESHPDWIPYRTTYYHRNWGFCLPHSKREALSPGEYRAFVDSDLQSGHLTYGELYIPGQTEQEVLIYSHTCHPSLANDNLAGLAVTTSWAKSLAEGEPRRFSYRFVWGPGTIGSITWLARNEANLGNIRHGLVAVLLGRPGRFHYKSSRKRSAPIDKIAPFVLGDAVSGLELRSFDPYGYDERQFCSPGIDLPMGRLSRVPNGEYPEYHTSADNPSLVSSEALDESLEACLQISDVLDADIVYENQLPKCEPQLGKRGLYGTTGGMNPKQREHAILWLLSQSDGTASLLDVVERSGLPFDVVREAAEDLVAGGLLRELAS